MPAGPRSRAIWRTPAATSISPPARSTRGGFEDAGLDGYRARMGFQHAMRAAHTSVEGALVRILPCIDAFRERIDPPEAPRPG
ncbi:hypothetical protein [Methylobacterium oxalidis]|uniref:hypothetical protein n=1 Tax=Methylobacterium oxalidis TaxID=944322 RepID=UPI003314802C